jgi:hypothetical protein
VARIKCFASFGSKLLCSFRAFFTVEQRYLWRIAKGKGYKILKFLGYKNLSSLSFKKISVRAKTGAHQNMQSH